MNILGNISIETFLAEYWQKKPLLIRNAFPNFECPIEPDDLAGLALEEDAESRLIFENGKNGPWELLHGPFTEETFAQLPEEKWTLLVQAVDQWVPELADLLDYFKFIPSWRLDDIMASFAPKGGSVGPHFDQYDVFLLQAHGQRHWQVGPKYKETDELVSGTDLKILKKMQVADEWTLSPGDMLYIPPQFAHNGVALDDCMTLSIGFRAPSEADIISHLADEICTNLTEDLRYSDADISNAEQSPAFIDEDSIERIQAILAQRILNKENIKQWFSQYMTESKYPDLHEPLEEALEWDEVAPFFAQASAVIQNETTRWAYYQNNQEVNLVINGQAIEYERSQTSEELVVLLSNQRKTKIEQLDKYLQDEPCQQLLLELINLNHLYFDE
ncbi:MAG: cupin domain-containing protein [Gammaproteobacteria bacterium]|nr:cupin domain-containing protein [Gammaproteobacteria bacterium]